MSDSDLSPDDANRNRGRTDKSLEDEVRRDDTEEATVRYTLDLPKSLHKRLKQHALIEEERSMKDVTTEAIEDYLRKHE
jgi:hypothetical protein